MTIEDQTEIWFDLTEDTRYTRLFVLNEFRTKNVKKISTSKNYIEKSG